MQVVLDQAAWVLFAVGADAGKAGRAVVLFGELADHLLAGGKVFDDQSTGAHAPVRPDDHEALAGAATADGLRLEKLDHLAEVVLGGKDGPVGFLPGEEFVDLLFELGHLLRGDHELVLIGSPHPGVGAVVHPDTPLFGKLRHLDQLAEILAMDDTTQGDAFILDVLDALEEALDFFEEAGNLAEGVVPLVRVIKRDGELVHPGGPQALVAFAGQERGIGGQHDKGVLARAAHGPDDVLQILPQGGLAAGDLGHDRLERAAEAAKLLGGGLLFVGDRATEVTVVATCVAAVGDFKGYGQGLACQKVFQPTHGQ